MKEFIHDVRLEKIGVPEVTISEGSNLTGLSC